VFCGGVIVVKIPTFDDPFPPAGTKHTLPSLIRVAPAKGVLGTGVEFEYVILIGSTIPTFELLKGAMTTFPVGKRHPPQNALGPGTFVTILDKVAPVVPIVSTQTFPEDGTRTMLYPPVPLDVRTPPENLLPSLDVRFETVRVWGLKTQTLEFVCGTQTTLVEPAS
jgi:hypothetical protein